MRATLHRLRARRTNVTITVVAAGLVPLALAAGLVLMDGRSNATTQRRQAAKGSATAASGQLGLLFGQWKADLLIAANNEVLTEWYRHPDQQHRRRPVVNRVLLQLDALYPGLIDEACLIDAQGQERAREVRGTAAPLADLSPDEAANPFFAPTLALQPGLVHQHGPYVSPDSGRWVISNSTPLVVDGRKVGLLHYEESLEGVRQRLRSFVGEGERAQVVDATGRVVIDTAGPAIQEAAFPTAASRGMSGVVVGANVPTDASNENHWRVQVAVPAAPAVSGHGMLRLGGLALVTVLGLLLLARSFQRKLTGPLARMTEIARRLADGDLTQRIAHRRQDDVGVMAAAMNDATAGLHDAVSEIAGEADHLAGFADELLRLSTSMAAEAETTSTKAHDMLVSAAQVNDGIENMSEASQAVGMGVLEVAQQATEASKVADHAVVVADRTAETIGRLGLSSVEIGGMLDLISSIAAQTNLLALNATIEAARAGDAGKGFAVVASEVKDLARETAAATERVNVTIASIRADTAGAIEAMDAIKGVITEIRTIQGSIVETVEGQRQSTAMIGESARSVAAGSDAITKDVSSVAGSARTTTDGARQTREAAQRLAGTAEDLHRLLGRFSYHRSGTAD